MFFKDDIDAGVALVVNATVIEGCAASFWRGPNIAAASLGVLPHQDQSNKHDLSQASFVPGISV